jgi:hypothetical protein
MQRIICNDKLWKDFLVPAIVRKEEVELVNFDYEDDGDFCEKLADQHGMIFQTDPDTGYGRFTYNSG